MWQQHRRYVLSTRSSRRERVFGCCQTPGQAKSKARKFRAKQEKEDRLRAEAARRGISVHQVSALLYAEFAEAAKLRRKQAAQEAQLMDRRDYRRNWW